MLDSATMIDPRRLYDSNDLAWLQAPRDCAVEGPWIERKKSCDARTLAKQISGFANGQPPGGLIVIGVDPAGGLAGISSRREAVNKMLAEFPGMVDASDVEYRFVTTPDGTDQVLFVYVPYSGRRVVTVSGIAHCRRGDTTQELKSDELRELRHARGEVKFEDEPAIAYDEGMLDGELTESLLAGMKRRNGLTMPLTLESALRQRRLVLDTRQGPFLTMAGLLAVARDPLVKLGGARVRFLKFEGRAETFGAERNVVKDEWFEGPIPRIVRTLRDFMRTQVREFDYLGPEGSFVRDSEYPEFAWDEALVNALVHRSYSLSNACVFVRMFDDRLEVESPGGFPTPGVPSPADPTQLPSNPTNPNLASALQYFELVRLAQEGTRRMDQEMRRLGLPPPRIEELLPGPRVRVTLWNDIDRRKARLGTDEAKAAWTEIAAGLADELALYRRKAMRKWKELQHRGALAPPDVVDVAVKVMRDPRLADAETEDLVSLLTSQPLGRHRTALAEDFVKGAFEGQPRLHHVAELVRLSDDALEVILAWLENSGSTAYVYKSTTEAAFGALHTRVQRDPLPSRAWVERVANVSAIYSSRSAMATRVYTLITGRPPQ